MSVPKILEEYLSKLEKTLGPISVSEKAEIITEIKSHVMEAMDREGAKDAGSILASLGEPEQVANRYLLERGLKPQKPPKHPILKWVTVGFLGTVGLVMVFVLILLWKFTPIIIRVDEQNDRVIILGGLIDVNGSADSVKVGSIHVSDRNNGFVGSMPFDPAQIKSLEITFINAKIELANSNEKKFEWDCSGSKPDNFITQGKDRVKFSLSEGHQSKCAFKIPAGSSVSVGGVNGKVYIDKPHFALSIRMDNGKVDFSPDPVNKYKFVNSVVHGKMDSFDSSDVKDAINISIAIKNGKILKN
ncbi:MAG: DUF1700 domain-containing protein [Bdellovibrionota bacterium]